MVFEKHLRFDFGILNNKKEVLCLIEFQGIQHYEPVEYFGGTKTLKKNKKRDKMKFEYCTDKNLPLIRIPYWDFEKIEEILDKELLIHIKDENKAKKVKHNRKKSASSKELSSTN